MPYTETKSALVLYLVFQRHFVQGIAGAVK